MYKSNNLSIEKLEKKEYLHSGPVLPDYISDAIELFPDTAIVDTDLEAAYQSCASDGLDFVETRDLFAATSDNGFTGRFEYLQLQRYIKLSEMPEYVNYLSNVALDTILFNDPEPIIDIVFNGKDLPSTSYSYIEVEGQLFVDGITQEDPKQGRLNDCYFITALGATAQNNPQLISNMITEVDTNIWVVRYYNNAGKKLFVTVNNELPNVARSSVFADWNGELWPSLLEKAYAQVAPDELIRNRPNAYTSIEWGDSSKALRHITGQEGIRIKGIGKQGYIDYLENNQPIMISYQHHSYTFEYYNQLEDKFFLRNPYQYFHNYASWETLSEAPMVGNYYGGYVVELIV